MTAAFGRIGEFEPEKEDWTSYVERLGHFFHANGIDGDDKKRSVFLSVIGPGAYKLLRSLLSPEKPGDKSFKSLTETMTKHYDPVPSEIVQRYKFHTRFRQSGETVSTYVSELRSLAEPCNFGATLDLMLRDRLVCGINDDAVQRRLLSEQNLTFDKALTTAQGLEAAAKNPRELHHDKKPSVGNGEVHKVARDSGPRRERREGQTLQGGANTVRYRCGKPGHSPIKCRHRGAKCHSCGKVGHLRSVCRSKPQKAVHGTGRTNPVVSRLQESQEYPLFLVGDDTKVQKPLEVTVQVHGWTPISDGGGHWSISVFDIAQDLPAALAKSSLESLISQPSYILRRSSWSVGRTQR